MTTESLQHPRSSAGFPLLGAVLVTGLVGAVVVLVAALVAGAPGAAGAAIGVAMVLGVLGLGSAVVQAVASLVPAAALLVELLTYTLQVLLLLVAFVALERSGVLGEEVSRGWLASALVTGTLGWQIAHVVGAVRARIPLDLATAATASEQAPGDVSQTTPGTPGRRATAGAR